MVLCNFALHKDLYSGFITHILDSSLKGDDVLWNTEEISDVSVYLSIRFFTHLQPASRCWALDGWTDGRSEFPCIL